MSRPSYPDHFWSRVDKDGSNGCWIWTKGKDHNGYGSLNNENRRTEPAHRYAYRLLVGPIPEGLTIDHLCRNRACVNPAHLEAVTRGENTLRSPIAVTAINARKTHCVHGHPFDDRNTYRVQGKRTCRACNREAVRRYQARVPA